MIECIENENDEYVYVEPKNNITTFDFTGYELASLPNGVKDELIFDRESRTIKYIKRVKIGFIIVVLLHHLVSRL